MISNNKTMSGQTCFLKFCFGQTDEKSNLGDINKNFKLIIKD